MTGVASPAAATTPSSQPAAIVPTPPSGAAGSVGEARSRTAEPFIAPSSRVTGDGSWVTAHGARVTGPSFGDGDQLRLSPDSHASGHARRRKAIPARDHRADQIGLTCFVWLHDQSPDALAGFEEFYGLHHERFAAFLG